MNKKGVSQVVSAVLLITMVVALATAFGYVYMNLVYTYEASTQSQFFDEIGVPNGCDPNYSPGEWSGCEISYNLNSLVAEEFFLEGIRKRSLKDLNGCASDKPETEKCSSKEMVTLQKIGNFLEIRNIDGLLVSNIEIDDGKLNIEFII